MSQHQQCQTVLENQIVLLKIDASWFTWQEVILKKYPGYKLGFDQLLSNVSDITIDLDELLSLFRSKDIDRYM